MKNRLKLLFQMISLLLFVAILWWGGPDAWRQIQAGDWRFVLLALLLRGAAGMVASARLLLVTKALTERSDFSWRQLYYLTMTARALGLVIPRSVSTIGGKSVALKSFGISLKRSVWIILIDNLFDVILLAAVTIPGLLFLQGIVSLTSYLLLLLIAVTLLLVVVWGGVMGDHLRPFLHWLMKFRLIHDRLHVQLSEQTRLLPPPLRSVQVVGISLLLNVLLSTSFYCVGRSMHVEVPIWIYVAAYPLVQLSLIAAVTPGGLGIFELGWIGLLVLGGMAQPDAVAFSVVQRAYLFVFVLIWAFVSLLFSLTERKNG